MSIWGVALEARSADWDVRGRAALADVRRRGLTHIESVRATRLYFLRGELDRETVTRLAGALLVDPVVETFRVFEGIRGGSRSGGDRASARVESCGSTAPEDEAGAATVEVHYQPGVMDPVAETALRTARKLLQRWGLGDRVCVEEVRTGWRYAMIGVRDRSELEWIARRVLANDCIETTYIDGFGRSDERPIEFAHAPVIPFVKPTEVALLDRDDAGLAALSREGHLFLSIGEMRAIQEHFRSLGREPTDVELETLAQTWSEHCVHKTLKSRIVYRGLDFGRDGEVGVQFDNLLKFTIMAATQAVRTQLAESDEGDWCLSVFTDNAGVIAFDDEYAVAFKVETHNHPSAIEPYGGAATGVGGVIRDILGCGLGAKPIASTDVFCLAAPDWPEDRLPEGVLHPRRVLAGVVSGVRDYGNRMGIPTVNGAIHFDPRYLTNPLVFCGCVGLIPRDRIAKGARAGDRIVLVGGRTGRDGIHGATFSSSELTDTHADEFSHAVQIGNAIEEKKVLDAILTARDHERGCLYSAITDCGAGGLSSAVGEMGATLGAVVDLDKVPLKYAGLRYDEIWISEAQERMVLAVREAELETLLSVFAAEEVEATVIGTFTGDGRLHLRFAGRTVGDLDMEFLHHGLPRATREAEWGGREGRRDEGHRHRCRWGRRDGETIGQRLLGVLAELNVASKEWVIRQYDHEVQGCSVVKPLVGVGQGPSDAAVVRPRLDSDRAIALACGLCPQVADDDPYEMAIGAVDESLRNVICVGGNPSRTAILDNFCWGGVDTPRALGGLVRACRGAHDAAVAYGLPFISGKDSLNNQFSQSEEQAAKLGMPARVSIPDTLLISAISVIPDALKCMTMDLKRPGSRLVCVGGFADRSLESMRAIHQRVSAWIRAGDVLAAHDVSDGGLAAALAEMCIAGHLGATVDMAAIVAAGDVDEMLFGEWRCCYVLECAPDARIQGDAVADLGLVESRRMLTIKRGGEVLAELSVEAMNEAWRRPLAAVGGV